MSDNTVQTESFNADSLTEKKLKELIFYRESFDIANVNDISETVKKVEHAIELRCTGNSGHCHLFFY